ncbi:MAG: endonuclease [Prevotella sp.]|nr:endonuclease [Prevotella sp.]
MKKTLLCLVAWTMTIAMGAQAPHNTGTYYASAHGKKGAELKTALYEIINTPAVVDYDSLWHAYQYSDAKPTDTVPVIWDMYSCKSAYSIYTTLHRNGKLGTDPEGTKGFQREHSMPKSWFNPAAKSGNSYTYKDIKPMFSDIVHVIPAEGIVNNKRSNNPYGTNNGEFYTSEEGFSKMGACTYPGYTGRCFEPNDEYKGDLARIYFYMVTAYEKRQPSWSSTKDSVGDHCGTWTSAMFNLEDESVYQPFAQWALDMLMQWSKQDPVSEKELARNEAIYQLQGNRNPFVDYPGLEDYIWGEKKETAFDYGGEPVADDETMATDCTILLNEKTFGTDWSSTDYMRNYFERIPLNIEQNGISLTFSYGIEGARMYCDTTQIRLYNKNTLTFKAHHNGLSRIEFVVPEKSADKEFIPSVGEMNGFVWTAHTDTLVSSVQFTSTYTSSWPVTNANKHIQIEEARVEVVNKGGIDHIKSATATRRNHIYNMYGMRMNEHNLRPGMYICNNRKFLIK